MPNFLKRIPLLLECVLSLDHLFVCTQEPARWCAKGGVLFQLLAPCIFQWPYGSLSHSFLEKKTPDLEATDSTKIDRDE